MPRITPKIPQGLEELMLNLAKSVIKENPQNLYEFAADYFEKLLKERDGKVDDSYKKLPAYKAYKRAKLEKNKLEVEGIKVELEARRRIGSAQASKSFSRSSSATKNVEKLPKIASASAATESVPAEAENSRKSTKKLPNISGTAGKIGVGAVAVGVAAGAVKPALMAVKPQRKFEEVVDYNDNVEGSQGVEGNLDSLGQSAADNLAGTDYVLAESEVNLVALEDAQKKDENAAQNSENSELISADLETNPADITRNSELDPDNSTGTSELSALKFELVPDNAQNLDEILKIEPQTSLKTADDSENQAIEPQNAHEAPQNSQNQSPEPHISLEHPKSPVPIQLDSSTSPDDFIECSTVDVSFLNRDFSPNDDIMAENSNEIIENMIDSNERKVDGNVGDKMNEISKIAGNKNNDDENIGMTDKRSGNEVELSGDVDENVGNSIGLKASQEVEDANENVETHPKDQVTKLTKVLSINSASSGENDYHSSNPSIKSSEFSNLSGESVKYQVLNVSSDTQESQSFDENYAGNLEAGTENLLDSSSDSKPMDATLTKSDLQVEEPSEFGNELVDRIRYFEENNEILEETQEAVEDMETKFEKFGEIMRKIEESDERTEEDFVKLSKEVDNESGNLMEVGDKLREIEGKLDNEVCVDVKRQDLGLESAHLENNVASKSIDLEDKEQNVLKDAKKSAKNSKNLPENSEKLTENAEKLVEIAKKLENLEAIAESSDKIDENVKLLDNENQNDSKLNPEDESNQIAEISEDEAMKLQKIDENDNKIELTSSNVNIAHDTDGQETKDADKVVKNIEESLETSEYDLDDFNPEDPNETSESPIKKALEVQQSIDESSKIFEQEVINIENILDTFEKMSPEVVDYKFIGDDNSDELDRKMLNSDDLRDSEVTNAPILGSGIEVLDDQATLNLKTEPTIDPQVLNLKEDTKSPKMSPKNSKIQNNQKSPENLQNTPQHPLRTSSTHQEPSQPTSPDYYQEIDSKATTAEMKDDDFIFKSPSSTDISKLIEQKFTVDDKSTKKSVQGKESETSDQNDIELSQENANEAATGSDNCEKEIKADEFANKEEIGVENGNFNGVDNLMAENEESDKDKAAVKIQSLFRGYQVRKSGKIEKFEEKLDEIVNNKFAPKVQEPSEFGAELVSKIQEFEENVEDLEGTEEVVEDMEVKFEKFGEIMRKIEESGEKFEHDETEVLDARVKNADNSEKIVENLEKNGSNLDAIEEIVEKSDTKSSKNYLNVKQGPVKSASYKEIVQAISVDAVDVVSKESPAEDSRPENYEDPTSIVDGNITETSKDEDFIDILLDEPTQNEFEQQNVQDLKPKGTRNKRSISPETGEILTKVTLRIDPDDSWTEDFDALKVTKTHQIRPKSAMRPLQHELLGRNSKEIQVHPNLLTIDSQSPQISDRTSQKSQKVPEGVDEVDSHFDGQDNQPQDTPVDNPADNPHPSYPVDIKVINKDINETILDSSEQTKQKNDDINDKLIEAQIKAEKKAELEGNEEAEINEIVSKSERPMGNTDNAVDLSLNGLQSGGNIDTSVIKDEEELEENYGALGTLEDGNGLNGENLDVVEQLNEQKSDDSSNKATKDDTIQPLDALSLQEVVAAKNNNSNSIFEQPSKQPEDSSSSDSSNDSSGFNYEVLPSPPTDSPGNSENEANFDEIVRSLTPNMKENDKVEENFDKIVENLQENVKNSEENSENSPQILEQSIESSDNPTRNTQIFDKYLDIYDENLENFEYFTNNPDGTLKKSHKIVEKLNEIVDDEVAKYVEKLDGDCKGIKADGKTKDAESEDLAQFDVFEYAVPHDEVEEAPVDDNKMPEKLVDLPLVFMKGEDKSPEVEPENYEILSPEPEIIEEPITKVKVKPQLSQNIPISQPKDIPEPSLKKGATPSKSPDEIENAAVKIQSFFRGFKVRKGSKSKRKSAKKSKDSSVFGNELVDKIQEFEAESEVRADSEEVIMDMETKFEKFGEIMKKIEESDEKIEMLDEILEVQKDNKAGFGEPEPQKVRKNAQNFENSATETSKSKEPQEPTTLNPTFPKNQQDTILASQILNPLQGFEKLTQTFEHKLEENSAEQAAVKIQSLFRGFKVRQSHPPKQFKQNVKEPSAFGSELVDKIEEFEESEVKNENLEEVAEDMEAKFEKFGEIMRKIEESEENLEVLDENVIIQDENSEEKAEKNSVLDAENKKKLEGKSENSEVVEESSVQKHVKFIESKLQTESMDNNMSQNSIKNSKFDKKSPKLDTKPPQIDVNPAQPASSQDEVPKPQNDTEEANAAVKIQSFFRGFKVRKSNPAKRIKPQEPGSGFGSELVDKIEELKDNNENLESSEEIAATMEEKFEKFSEILKKIEESENVEELDETGNIQEVSNEQQEVLSADNPTEASILKENEEKSNKFDTLKKENSKMTENLENPVDIQQGSTDNKPQTATTSKPMSSKSKKAPNKSIDDETNAAVKIQSFFRGFKVRKSHNQKSKELNSFGAELIDKIEESEAKNKRLDEYVEDMEAEFEKFGDIMKKIEESDEKLDVLDESLKIQEDNLDNNEGKSAENFGNSEESSRKMQKIKEKSENQQSLAKVDKSQNLQNYQPTPTAPPSNPEDLPKIDPQQPTETDQMSCEEYEEVDQLSTIYEQNSVDEEPCTEKFISRCGLNLEQNDNEKVICGQEESGSKLWSEELTSNLESNAAENSGAENEKLIGKISTHLPLVKLEDKIEAEMQKMTENLDQKSQKFVKIGDKFVIVEENLEFADETPKTDNEVLDNLAKSTEKLSKLSEKMSKSPAKNSNFEVTSENFEEISKQFDQISKEYDKLYRKIEEKFEENVQVLKENSVILDENKNFGENFDGKLKNFKEKLENSVKIEPKTDPGAPQLDDETSSEQAKAAVKIQSTFRGYKVRKSRFQKFKDNLSEKFNLKTEQQDEEPSTFGSELVEKIKDFGENEENSEEIVENMEEKFEMFGDIMRKIEESQENLKVLDENLKIQEENLINFEENVDEFDMDSLEYEASNQNYGTKENLTQKVDDSLKNLQEIHQKFDNKADKLTENFQILKNIPDFSEQPLSKIPQNSSKIPIKQKLSVKSESLQDLVPTDSKSINKLSHSTDHTPLLSPNNSDSNLLRRQSYIDSVIHELEGSHVIEGGLIGYAEQFNDLQAGNVEGVGQGDSGDVHVETELEDEVKVEGLGAVLVENDGKTKENSQNINENYEKLKEHQEKLMKNHENSNNIAENSEAKVEKSEEKLEKSIKSDDKTEEHPLNPSTILKKPSIFPTIPSSSHQKIIPIAKVQPENIKALTSKSQQKLDPEAIQPKQASVPHPPKQAKNSMMRQKTMPVQFESSVMRVLPKHLRKRIQSAEGEKKKKRPVLMQ